MRNNSACSRIDHFAAGSDTASHAQRMSQRVDQFHRCGRHDVGGPAGLAVPLDQVQRLGAHLVEQLRCGVGVEAHQVVVAHALHHGEDAVAHADTGFVAGTTEAELHRFECVVGDLGARHQTGAPGSHGQHEGARPTDERAIEIEERRAGAAGG